jgi:hypothetical protein
MKPEHVAKLGVGGFGALCMSTRGWIDEEVVVVSIPVQAVQRIYGGSAAGGGPAFIYEPIPYEPEIPSEPTPGWREHVAELVVRACASRERWTTTEEVLATAARAASDGRLSPTVRSWAVRELVAAGGPESVTDRIEALLGAVRASFYDVPNPVGAQWIASADELYSGVSSGACVDYCVKLASALLSVGIPVALVGQSSGGEAFDHVALAAWDGRSWLRVDPSDRSVPLGGCRRAEREVWIELPDGRVTHRGAPPAEIVSPVAVVPSEFPLVGVGLLRPADAGLVRELKRSDRRGRSLAGTPGTGSGIVTAIVLAGAVAGITVLVLGYLRAKGSQPTPMAARNARRPRGRKHKGNRSAR